MVSHIECNISGIEIRVVESLSPPKGDWVATVEDRAYEAVYKCFKKNYADSFVSTFNGGVLGEVPGKSASFNWVTWFN